MSEQTQKALTHRFMSMPITWRSDEFRAQTIHEAHMQGEPAPARLGHYRLAEKLGSGGFGVVYRAIDERTGRQVALKMLHEIRPDLALALKKEFRALSQLRHENLVHLIELGLDQNHWFFTMELIEGEDFCSYLRPTSRPRLNYARLRVVLAQLALALQATHAAGFLHLDIKPSNILISKEGRLVLLDFGLVESLDYLRNPGEGLRLQGTPAYMAPEQVVGDTLSPASDWYAFGAVLYEVLTGSVAFSSPDPLELMYNKLRADSEPAPPSSEGERQLEAKEFEDLALRLIKRDPENRLTGPEVLNTLRAKTEETITTTSLGLVGREEELIALQDAYQSAHNGRILFTIGGPSGIGKSALLRSFLADARARQSALILHSKCLEFAEIPFRAFDGCIDELANIIASQSDKSTHATGPMAELSRIFPVLARALSLSPSRRVPPDPLLPAEARQRGFSTLIQLILDVACERPLILVFDDLQWSDSDSERLMRDIIHESQLSNLLIVATYRSDLPRGPVLSALPPTGESVSGLEVRELSLRALSDESSCALLQALLGDASDDRARELASQTRGFPFFIEELARHEQTERLLAHSNRSESPTEVETLILGGLARLSGRARAAAEFTAVADRPISYTHLKAALEEDLERDEIRELSRVFTQTNVHGEVLYEPRHARTRSSILSQMHPTTSRLRHATLARVYEDAGATDPASLARHHREAGARAKAGEYALKAAETASYALAFGQAAEFYEQALEDLKNSSTEQLDSIRRSLAHAQGNFGRGREAAESFLACAECSPEDEHELRAQAALHYLTSGELEKGTQVYRDLAAAKRVTLPRSRRGILAGLLTQLIRLRLRGTKVRIKPDDNIPVEKREQLDLLIEGYRGYATFKPLLTGYLALSILNRSLKLGYERGILHTLDYYGLMGAYVGSEGEEKRGFAILDQVADLSRACSDPMFRARVGMGLGVASTAVGRFRESVDHLDETSPRLEKVPGSTWELTVIENTRVQALIWLGEFARARRCSGSLLRRSEQIGDRFSTVSGKILDAMLLLAENRVQAARAQLENATKLWTRSDYTFQSFFAMKCRVWCDLYSDDSDSALSYLEADRKALKESGLLSVQLIQAEHLYLGGVVHLARGVALGNARSKHVEKLAQRLEKIPRPYTQGYAATLRTGLARLQGDNDLAVRWAHTAAKHFHDASMRAHSASVLLSVGNHSERSFLLQQGVKAPELWRRLVQPG